MKTKGDTKQITVGFVALGCPKNIVDSERMLAEIARAGLVITENADNADVVVINTCGFIAPAKAEAMEAIGRAVKQKRKGKVGKIIVAGCLPQRIGRRMLEEAADIDVIVGLEGRDDIARIIRRTLAGESGVSFVTSRAQSMYDDRVRLRITPEHYAYLRISEGCSRGCSFCTIPKIRGKARSKPIAIVLDEARRLVGSGAVELIIIGQDITNYGRDRNVGDALPKLLRELTKIPRLAWIRLLYLYPTGVSDELVETVGDSERILHYFDIPLQHINPEILRRMRRPHAKERIYRLVEKLRARIPDCVLRTTMIVGFPGETEEQFEELLEFVRWAKFDNLGAFRFYAEEGTGAARMAGQIPGRVKKRRLRRLMLTQQRIAFEKNRARIGNVVTCIVDSVAKRRAGRARFYGQAPEIDSVCTIKNCRAECGSFVRVKVTGTKNYDLICEQL